MFCICFHSLTEPIARYTCAVDLDLLAIEFTEVEVQRHPH